MIKLISKKEAMQIIKATKGKIFCAEFIKKTDETFRRMDCRTEVKKGTKNKGLKFDPWIKGLAPVFEMLHLGHEPDDKHFRFVNVDSLLTLKFQKVIYVINGK